MFVNYICTLYIVFLFGFSKTANVDPQRAIFSQMVTMGSVLCRYLVKIDEVEENFILILIKSTPPPPKKRG